MHGSQDGRDKDLRADMRTRAQLLKQEAAANLE